MFYNHCKKKKPHKWNQHLGDKMPYKRRARWSRKASTENSMVSNWINVKTYKLTERIFIGTNNHSIWGGGGGWRQNIVGFSAAATFSFGFRKGGVAVFSGSTSYNWRRRPITFRAGHSLKSLGDYCWRFLFLQFADTFSLFSGSFGVAWYVEPLVLSRVHFLGIS